MPQVYLAIFLVVSSFGGGYQVATWKFESEMFQQEQKNQEEIILLGQDAAEIIEQSLKESVVIQTKWRTKYEKVYIREPSDCLDADGVWDWNDANESASKTIISFDSLPEPRKD